MTSIMDLCVIVVIALFALYGLKIGLIRTVLKFVSLFLSIILALALYPVVSNALSSTGFAQTINEMVKNSNVLIPSVQDASSLQNSYLNLFGGTVSNITNSAINSANTAITSGVTHLILNIISFILVFIIIKILIAVLSNVLNLISHLPVIRQFNKIGGFIVGGIQGVLVIYLILALLIVFAPMKNASALQKYIDDSTLAHQMYYNNAIVNILNPK